MSDSLGLSIGMTNLVAARMGRPPVMRRSVLTVFDDRAPEVGVPSGEPQSQPARHGAERIRRAGRRPGAVGGGGRVTASRRAGARRGPRRDGTHRRRRYTRRDRGARALGARRPSTHCAGRWQRHRAWRPGGVPPALVPDSVAALSALQAAPGLPPNGVVVLCDFGGSGTSITLADAASRLQHHR